MEKEAPGVLRVCRGAAALCPVHAVQGMVGAYFDTLMWLPVILIFSGPYTAPLVAMAGRGASLVLGGGILR